MKKIYCFIWVIALITITCCPADAQGKKNRNKPKEEAAEFKITNPEDEIALMVSADGVTKEEATKLALRSAIEQAFGTFVSANTTILNDELVKEEIATISSGNIKSYNEVASVVLPNGRTSVTLGAIVCVSKLVSYSQSKGSTAEFAGATFGMNMKMKELNARNEAIAMQNLYEQVKAMLPKAYDRELALDNPVLSDNCYVIRGKIFLKKSEVGKIMSDLIITTIGNLCLSREELEDYQQSGWECRRIEVTGRRSYTPRWGNIEYFRRKDGAIVNPVGDLALRHGCFVSGFCRSEEMFWLTGDINAAIMKALASYTIIDNTGEKSSRYYLYKKGAGFIAESTGLIGDELGERGVSSRLGEVYLGSYGTNGTSCEKICLRIPKEDIGKYTSFTVEQFNY